MEREVGGRISGHFVSVKQWNLLHTDSISQLVVLSLHFGVLVWGEGFLIKSNWLCGINGEIDFP